MPHIWRARWTVFPVRWSPSLHQTNQQKTSWTNINQLSQLMRLWYLSHRRPAKAQASLRMCAVSPETSLFANMKYGSRRRGRPKIRHLAPLDGCACAFEEWAYGGRKIPYMHNLVRWLHSCLTSLFWDLGKQFRPRSDIAEHRTRPLIRVCTVCIHTIQTKKWNINEILHQIPLKLEMDSSNW